MLFKSKPIKEVLIMDITTETFLKYNLFLEFEKSKFGWMEAGLLDSVQYITFLNI